MNIHRFRSPGLAILGAVAFLIGGCASRTDDTDRPRPGSGIGEFRSLTREAHRAVTATVVSLEALAQPATGTPHPALQGFDRALERLELDSFRIRSRAEAIIARGQGYFDEWKEHMVGITNQASAAAENQRYEKLHARFAAIQERTAAVRAEFQPFMTSLRQFRAWVGPAAPAGDAARRTALQPLMAGGRRVIESLQAVSKSLDEAETELRATIAGREARNQ